MLNVVILSGHLMWPYDETTNRAKEKGELRTTENGSKYAIFRLRTLSGRKDQNGNPIKMYIRCIAWNEQAEKVVELPSGAPIEVVGRLDLDEFTFADGNKQKVCTIIAQRINNPPYKFENNGNKYTPPGEPVQKNSETVNADFDEISYSEDDIPF